MSLSCWLQRKWKHDGVSLPEMYACMCISVLLPGQHSLATAEAVFSSPPGLALKTKHQHKQRSTNSKRAQIVRLNFDLFKSTKPAKCLMWASCLLHLICFHIINLQTAAGMLDRPLIICGVLHQWNRSSTAAFSSDQSIQLLGCFSL